MLLSESFTLEKKRPSIARLKLNRAGDEEEYMEVAWKEKTLDCEIETYDVFPNISPAVYYTWKEKTLDCEIETLIFVAGVWEPPNLKRKDPRLRDWNL